jgi:hypothetical protein
MGWLEDKIFNATMVSAVANIAGPVPQAQAMNRIAQRKSEMCGELCKKCSNMSPTVSAAPTANTAIA